MAAFTVVMAYTVDDVYADNYSLWVGGAKVEPTHPSGNYWRYIATSRTLIFENNNDEHPGVITAKDNYAAVQAGSDLPDLTIVLDSNGYVSGNSQSQGCAIKVNGTGTLTIKQTSNSQNTLNVTGTIETDGDLIIQDTKVMVSGGADDDKGCINVGGLFKVEDTAAGSDAIVNVEDENDNTLTAIKAGNITLTGTGIQTPAGGTISGGTVKDVI